MLRTHKMLSLSLSAVLTAGMALAASANTQILASQSITSGTDFTGSFLFQKFDPSLGTLTSVFLTLGTDLSTTLTVTNNSGSASSGTADTKLQAIIADPSTTFTTTSNVLNGSGGLFKLRDSVTTDGSGDGSDSYSLSGTGSTTLTPPEATHSLNTVPNLSSPAVLSFFTGSSGFAQINYKTFTSTILSNTGGNTTASQATTDTFTVGVQYNYTPASSATPEPGTWAMLVAGASTGLVALRRRRNKK